METRMTDLTRPAQNLTRPRLLMQAARSGLALYRRERDLKRIAGSADLGPGPALDRLISIEAGLEATRRAGDAAYSVATHVDVLIALLAEARALGCARPG
jgi:hypothetical protein